MSTAEIKWQRLKEERSKHKDNTRCVIEKEIDALGVNLSTSLQAVSNPLRKCSWDTWTVIDPPSLIYPVYLCPPGFLLQWGCAEPISYLASRIPLLDHSINQCEIDSFLTDSQSTKQPSHRNGYDEKRFW